MSLNDYNYLTEHKNLQQGVKHIMMPPFFSIITPVYNCEKYLKECISSVINQTYPSWELILVDDGSTDLSGKICDEFCQDTRIKVIHQKNAGALDSRINGIGAAAGEYGLGLDADDYLDVNALERIKQAIDASGSDLIFFGFRHVGKRTETLVCSLEAGKVYSKKEIMNVVIGEMQHSLWNKAIRMDKLKGADYSGLTRRISINLDYAQIIPVICMIDTGYVIPDILYNYRIYGDSISHSCKTEHILDTGTVTEYVIRKLEEDSLLDEDFYRLTYLAYLNMIDFRILQLFINRKISREDCRNIHASESYRRAGKFESLRYIDFYKFMILKMFRYKQYWALKLLAMVQGSRNHNRNNKGN